MTPNAYMTDPAWQEISPLMSKGLRHVVVTMCLKFGIPKDKAMLLIIAFFFDGVKFHTKNLKELIKFADDRVLACVENRDSSTINQAFDKFVALAGKRRGSRILDLIRRSHVYPVIDQWTLILVGLDILRDCAASNVWENSFIAVNMHPHYRLNLEDWLEKIKPFTLAADKFEEEEIHELELLPPVWTERSETDREKWIKIIDEDGASWDVDMINKLREADMPLPIVVNIFKIYTVVKRAALRDAPAAAPACRTPTVPTKKKVVRSPPDISTLHDKGKMIYHLFNPKVKGLTPTERFEHACRVRNRTYGPKDAIEVSPHLDVEITEDNKRFLNLKPHDINMHRVLQECSVKRVKRRRVARRCLTALGGVSGMCGVLNDVVKLKQIKANLKFAASLEEVKHAEKELKQNQHDIKMQKHLDAARKKAGLGPKEQFFQPHADKLTINQMKAVAYMTCGGVKIKGKTQDVREHLKRLLPMEPRISEHKVALNMEAKLAQLDAPDGPEYATQDEYFSDNSDTETDPEVVCDMKLHDLNVGDWVEVYWPAEDKWFHGEIKAVDFDDQSFHVFYPEDEDSMWHCIKDFPVRMSC